MQRYTYRLKSRKYTSVVTKIGITETLNGFLESALAMTAGGRSCLVQVLPKVSVSGR